MQSLVNVDSLGRCKIHLVLELSEGLSYVGLVRPLQKNSLLK